MKKKTKSKKEENYIKVPKHLFAKGGIFSGMFNKNQGQSNGNNIGDVAMDAAVYGANYMLPVASVPLQALTGKSAPSLLGYEAKSDLGKTMEKGTGFMAKVQGAAAPAVASMFGGPAAGMGVSAAQQVGRSTANEMTSNQQPNQEQYSQMQGGQGQGQGSQMLNMGMQMAPMLMGMYNQNQQANESSGIGMQQRNGGQIGLGQTKQFNADSHEAGGLQIQSPNGEYEIEKEEAIKSTPGADYILSDKVKLPSTGKTAAKSIKGFLKAKMKSDAGEKLSSGEKLMASLHDVAFNKAYIEQEEVKQAKVDRYIKRMGGMHKKYPDGGINPNRQAFNQQQSLYGFQQSPMNPNAMYNMSGNIDFGNGMNVPYPIVHKYLPNPENDNYLPKAQPSPTSQYYNGSVPRYSKNTFGSGGPFTGQFGNNLTNAANYSQSFSQDDPRWYPTSDYQKDINDYNNQYPQDANLDIAAVQNQIDRNRVLNKQTSTPYTPNTDDQFKPMNVADANYDFGNPKSQPIAYKQMDPRWKDAAYQTAGTLAQSAGQLAYLREQGKKYDTQKFHNYNPNTLNDATAIAEARRQANAVNASLAGGAGGSANNYMSNRIQAGQSNANTLANIRMDYENRNAGIKNQAGMFNTQNQYMVDDRNQANKDTAYNNYYNQIDQLGRNTASGIRDYRANQMDQQRLAMYKYLYPNNEYQDIHKKVYGG